MNTNEKSKRGKAIVGIAMAAIMLASVLVAIVPTVSAMDVTGNYDGANPIGQIVNPGVSIIHVNHSTTITDTVRIGQEILFINDTAAGGWNASDYAGCEVKIEGYDDTGTEGISESTTSVRTMTVGDGTKIDNATRVGLYFDTKDWPTGKTGKCKVTFKKGTVEAVQNITVVATGTLSLNFKVGTKTVSSVALGKPFKIDTGSPPLGSNDEVDIVITKPDGTQLKFTTTPAQQFTTINESKLLTYAADPGVNTTDPEWDIGSYTIEVKSKEEHARGLAISSGSKDLTIVKGEIDIVAEKTSVVEHEILKLTVTGVAGDKIKVAADPSNNHVIFPKGVNDNNLTAEADNFIHSIDEDSTRTYAVKFNDTGSYTIKVTVTAGPRVNDYDTVDITVTEKGVTFDVPATIVIGQRFTIKGTSNTGKRVDIAVEDYVYTELNDLVLDENGEFEKEIDTSKPDIPDFTTPGSVRLKAYIDRTGTGKGVGDIGTAETDDGSVALLMTRGDLLAELSAVRVAQEDDFTIEGTAKGTKHVDIRIVSPKGYGGTKIDGTSKGLYEATASVSEIDFKFSKKISVGDDADTGRYLVAVLSPGADGKYGKTGEDNLTAALGAYSLTGRTQDEVVDVLDDLVSLSDDLIWLGYIKVEAAFVTLDTIADVGVGEPLVVTGTTNREEGFAIVVTVKGPIELTPKTVLVENGTFNITFDTTDAPVGMYTVKADDGDGHTDEVTVSIVTAVPTPTPVVGTPTPVVSATPLPVATPTPAAEETPTPTPTPPGFEAVFAIAGLLAVAYLVLRKRRK